MDEDQTIAILLTPSEGRVLETIRGHRVLARHGIPVRASHEALTVLYDTGSAVLRIAPDTDMEALSHALLEAGIATTSQPNIKDRANPEP